MRVRQWVRQRSGRAGASALAILAAALVLGLGAVGPARAFGIPIQVSPDGFDITQFPTLSPDYVVQSPLDWLPAGDRSLDSSSNPFTLVIDQTFTLLNNPVTPSPSNPFQLQLTWTVENNTQQTLDRVLLFLPRLAPPDAVTPDYTATPVEIEYDPATFVIVEYPDPSNMTLEHYLAFFLQDLTPGGQATVSFTYSVLAPLPDDPQFPGSAGTPVFEVAAATKFVPEPALGALLAVGLLGVVVRRGRRCV